jgi:hypothetical protein
MSELGPDSSIARLSTEEQMKLLHQALYPAGIFPGGTVLPMSHGDKKDWSFRPRWEDVDAQISYAVAHGRSPVYRSAVAMPDGLAPGARGSAKDAVSACALWADIDDSRGVHHVQELPDPSPEQAWEVLARYPLEPTGVIDTGGGLLAFWATTAFDPKAPRGRRLLQDHSLALETLHNQLGVAYDPALPRSVAPATRVPAGVNGKQIPLPSAEWPQERIDLMRKDIATAPVRLVWLQPSRRYEWEEIEHLLDDAGLLAPRTPRTAQAPGMTHVCGGPSPEERLCADLPMERVCREMRFVDDNGNLIEWADREDIPDGADDYPLTWSHENSRKIYAKLYREPPNGHEDMEPVSALTCWGTGTAAVFKTEANRGKVCTWRWLSRAYFQATLPARNFAEKFAGHPDEAMAVLAKYPRASDLLAAVPSLLTHVVVVDGGRGLVTKEEPPKTSSTRTFGALPWAKAHGLDFGPTDVEKWVGANQAKYYGVALDGAMVALATETGVATSFPLTKSTIEALTASLEKAGGRLYSHEASVVARAVFVHTGCRLIPVSTMAALRALNPGKNCDLPVKGQEEAMAVAALAESLATKGRWPKTAAHMDLLWAHLAVDGILVDKKMLRDMADSGEGSDRDKASELLRAAQLDGRIRPIVGAYGARTGRMTIRDPAIQNLAPAIRGALLADKGKALVGLDLHQIEPRVAAALSSDTAMRAAVEGDIYTEAANVIWPTEDIDSTARSRAKTILLAQLYGEGTKSLAKRLDIEEEEAGLVVSRLLDGWPDLRRWKRGLEDRARAGEQLLTLAGRPVPTLAPGEEWRAVNYVVQGSAADIFYSMITRVAKALGSGSRLWLAVHDELVVECPQEEADATKQLLVSLMSTVVNGVPINGDAIVYGTSWGAH